MNKIANRAVMCEVLKEAAAKDRDVVVLCSDSRGSASLTSFADTYPEQFVEVGIAEQNLVSVAAGLASCGKKAFAASPASFISTRSYEQCKVDCAYSGMNVKLIGISGGIGYGALGMTHHSAQDIAAMSAIPGMRVYLPSDRHQTRRLFEALLQDDGEGGPFPSGPGEPGLPAGIQLSGRAGPCGNGTAVLYAGQRVLAESFQRKPDLPASGTGRELQSASGRRTAGLRADPGRQGSSRKVFRRAGLNRRRREINEETGGYSVYPEGGCLDDHSGH